MLFVFNPFNNTAMQLKMRRIWGMHSRNEINIQENIYNNNGCMDFFFFETREIDLRNVIKAYVKLL